MRELDVTPDVTQNLTRAQSQCHRWPRRHAGYAMSQQARPLSEPAFALKAIAWIRKVKLRALAKVDCLSVFASAAFNLIRLPKLLTKRRDAGKVSRRPDGAPSHHGHPGWRDRPTTRSLT